MHYELNHRNFNLLFTILTLVPNFMSLWILLPQANSILNK